MMCRSHPEPNQLHLLPKSNQAATFHNIKSQERMLRKKEKHIQGDFWPESFLALETGAKGYCVHLFEKNIFLSLKVDMTEIFQEPLTLRTKLLSFELMGTALPDTKMLHHQVIVTQKLIFTSFLSFFLYLFMLTYMDEPNKQANKKHITHYGPFRTFFVTLEFCRHLLAKLYAWIQMSESGADFTSPTL